MGGGNLPNEIVQAISLANAKAIGEQPAILSNLALATQILNQNMQQQMVLAQQQAINQISLATTAKCIAIITQSSQGKPPQEEAEAAVKAYKEVSQLAEQFMKQVLSLFPKQEPTGPEPEEKRSPPKSGSREKA